MKTGSRDEKALIHDVHAIRTALERIARALEHQVFGSTVEDVRAASASLSQDLMDEVAPPRWPDPPPERSE